MSQHGVKDTYILSMWNSDSVYIYSDLILRGPQAFYSDIWA